MNGNHNTRIAVDAFSGVQLPKLLFTVRETALMLSMNEKSVRRLL